MTLCVIDGKQCHCQPDEGSYCSAACKRLSEADARIAELEKALLQFATAAEYADKQLTASNIENPMDRRDFFLWQAKRKLCVADFNVARNVYSKL